MKKTLLVTSLICSGLALGSLSENAKADDSQPVNTNSNQGQTQVNNGSTLINKQSATLQQPSENDVNTVLRNFTNDSGISTTQDGISYIVTQQGNGYQIELSQNMGQYNHLLAIYNYNPATHTFKQIGGDFQADTPMGQPLKQNSGEQENSNPVNSQQLGLTNEATHQDSDGSVHNANSDGLDHYYNAQAKTYQPQPSNNQPSQSNTADQTTSQPSQAKQLPQTGNANSKVGLGGLALASLTAMFALGKRKEEY